MDVAIVAGRAQQHVVLLEAGLGDLLAQLQHLGNHQAQVIPAQHLLDGLLAEILELAVLLRVEVGLVVEPLDQLLHRVRVVQVGQDLGLGDQTIAVHETHVRGQCQFDIDPDTGR